MLRTLGGATPSATICKRLFSWRDVERLPDLERLALEHLPDGELVSALDARRGKGRGDYPVRAVWRALAPPHRHVPQPVPSTRSKTTRP